MEPDSTLDTDGQDDNLVMVAAKKEDDRVGVSSKRRRSSGWSRALLKFGLVLVAYTIVMGAIFHQLLEENQLDVIIRKKVPDVL